MNRFLAAAVLSAFALPALAQTKFQGQLSYACGFQSNVNVMSVLWVTSDGTEDRAFIEQLTVAVTGTATLTKGSEVEFEGAQAAAATA